jgi:tRNA1(Val) A37 N6-methylase TrmN6
VGDGDLSDAPVGPTSEDALLGGRVRLLQPREGYRAAIDPVLLAAAVTPRPGERVLELGCGAGAALLCLAARVPDIALEGLELQPEAAALARGNAAAAGWGQRIHIHDGDLRRPPTALVASAFHRILANPPFHAEGAHTRSARAGKALSHGEAAGTITDWAAAAARLLRHRGVLTVIYPADRLDALVVALAGRFGSLRVLPLWSRAGRPARRVLVQAVRGGRGPLVLLPGMVLHEDGGRYTAAADAVLRHAAPIDWLGED